MRHILPFTAALGTVSALPRGSNKATWTTEELDGIYICRTEFPNVCPHETVQRACLGEMAYKVEDAPEALKMEEKTGAKNWRDRIRLPGMGFFKGEHYYCEQGMVTLALIRWMDACAKLGGPSFDKYESYSPEECNFYGQCYLNGGGSGCATKGQEYGLKEMSLETAKEMDQHVVPNIPKLNAERLATPQVMTCLKNVIHEKHSKPHHGDMHKQFLRVKQRREYILGCYHNPFFKTHAGHESEEMKRFCDIGDNCKFYQKHLFTRTDAPKSVKKESSQQESQVETPELKQSVPPRARSNSSVKKDDPSTAAVPSNLDVPEVDIPSY